MKGRRYHFRFQAQEGAEIGSGKNGYVQNYWIALIPWLC